MKENLDLNQILFDELVEFPRKRLGISIREFCAEAHVGTDRDLLLYSRH